MICRALAFLLCAGSAIAATPPPKVAITNVAVVSMTSETIDADQTVILSNGIIEVSGPASGITVPPDAIVIDGRKRWLMPGLIDSHVHLIRGQLETYLRYGITTVRELAGRDDVRAIARDVASGALRGPEIWLASPLLDGPNPSNPAFSTPVPSVSEIPAFVDGLIANGAQFLKVYNQLDRGRFIAINNAARNRGIRVVGHVPTAIPVVEAMTLGQSSIEHLSGYGREVTRGTGDGFGSWADVDESQFAPLVSSTANLGVWNCPTLYVTRILSESQLPPSTHARAVENRRRFVRALHEGGARIIAGTDAGWLAPAGFALYRELEELMASGLTPYEALRAATADAAEFLGDAGIGTVEEGKRANLILLRRNPLEVPATVARPDVVFLRGGIIDVQLRRPVRR